jgi:hypothetical protein
MEYLFIGGFLVVVLGIIAYRIKTKAKRQAKSSPAYPDTEV